jgi:hypothetical protein
MGRPEIRVAGRVGMPRGQPRAVARSWWTTRLTRADSGG